MAQPQWITESGSLGTIPENVFYQVPLKAIDPDSGNVYYELIAGELPDGIQVQETGIITGIPKPTVNVQGVPLEVASDVTKKFAIRAYTTKVVNGRVVVDRINDRTFTITVAGYDLPNFVTAAGEIATFFDGSENKVQIEFTDPDPNERTTVRIISGSLPPGMTITRSGLIAGIIPALSGPSQEFEFTVEITDFVQSNIRTFSIFVYARNTFTADNTVITADDTILTADVTPNRTPILITPPGYLGRYRTDNFFAFKFDGIDFDGDTIEYMITQGPGSGFDSTGTGYDEALFDQGTFALPPGLSLNSVTGWLSGYIPNQGTTELTYKFAIRVQKQSNPASISPYYYFTITLLGDSNTDVYWITNPDLGTIDNGATSMFSVEAYNVGGRSLLYKLISGSNSRLPQGLTLLPSGNIVGKVSFNTFALDQGTTTFDIEAAAKGNPGPTTFDSKFDFSVRAYSPLTENPGYTILNLAIVNGGSGYISTPTVVIEAPPPGVNALQATAGAVTIVGGKITSIAIGNPGRGYFSVPQVTITGGGGAGAVVIANVTVADTNNAVVADRRFSITVNRAYNEPYQNLYIKCMPPQNDRSLLSNLLQGPEFFPDSAVYRADDPNFGISKSVIYDHAFGLTASTVDKYAESLNLNHYWKNLVLGKIKIAQALNAQGKVEYEVLYCEVVDNLVNNQGQSVGKSVELAYPVPQPDSTEITQVYPNSLINMRDQVVDQIGQISPMLPLWMMSEQPDGTVLGFKPAWVIGYLKPGTAGKILYDIEQNFGTQLNIIDFKADRYELDRSQTYNWQPYDDSTESGKWIPYPPAATTFDNNSTVFDFGSTVFIVPADEFTDTDVHDKYLLYPKTNILGRNDGF